jgi:hypothetical protein
MTVSPNRHVPVRHPAVHPERSTEAMNEWWQNSRGNYVWRTPCGSTVTVFWLARAEGWGWSLRFEEGSVLYSHRLWPTVEEAQVSALKAVDRWEPVWVV